MIENANTHTTQKINNFATPGIQRTVTSLKKREERLSRTNREGERGKGERDETLSNQIFMKPYVCRRGVHRGCFLQQNENARTERNIK
jgi:hypothetical protein